MRCPIGYWVRDGVGGARCPQQAHRVNKMPVVELCRTSDQHWNLEGGGERGREGDRVVTVE